MKLFLNEKFIGILIIINAILTVYLCYDDPPFLQIILFFDYLVTMLFVCEITYKVTVYKKAFFKTGWNQFDFWITLISFLVMLYHISGETIGLIDNVIVLRTLRLFRFFRIIKVIPNIDKLFSDFKKALRVTSSILIAGSIILLIIGVVLCTMYKEFDNVNFGDPLVSIYSVFRIFSVEGWYEIPDAMCESTSYANATFIRVLFSLLVLFGTFILGFIISSISDELALDNNDELMAKTKELEAKIDLIYEKIDLLTTKE